MQLQPAPCHHFHSTSGAVRLVKKITNTKQNKSVIFKVLITTSWVLQGHILQECTSRVTLPTATTEWYFFWYTGSFVYYGNISFDFIACSDVFAWLIVPDASSCMTCILDKYITTLNNLPTPSLRSLLRSHLSHNGKDHGLCVHGECQNWYHFNHVGLSVAHEPLKEVWFCPKCTSTLN